MNIERHSHAHLGLQSRAKKALKIARLLNLSQRSGEIILLEIGTGAGGIAHHFATQADGTFDVHAVDVRDARVVTEGYAFTLVDGTTLPYDDASFDVVISNHVIEHVGTEADQQQHLREIHRVLKPAGLGYLAVPNRWMLIEPHYKLAFLSWLPHRLRSTYLRVMGKGHFYDCEPLELAQLEQLLAAARFDFRNVCVEAIHQLVAIEKPGSLLSHIVKVVPAFMWKMFAPVIPTLIFVLRKTPS